MAMKTKNYFTHDYHAREDVKLIKLKMKFGLEGIGAYWCLIEMLHENDGKIVNDTELIAYQLGTKVEVIELAISTCFESDDEFVYSERVIENLEFREQKRLENVEKGKKGASKRWNNDITTIPTTNKNDSKSIVTTKQNDSSTMPTTKEKDSLSIVKYSKEKEKEKEKRYNNIKDISLEAKSDTISFRNKLLPTVDEKEFENKFGEFF